ncbi:recombination protein NinB [Psychrobacter vallis]|uniref:recombination protein NinB n=1 Tax=Psychrobacter vallis TaxID=248451 RepID=UPI001917D2AA|nr:recombination protein NinB [Psychrobacter vallis]
MTKQKAKPLYFRLTSDEVRANCVKALFTAQSEGNDLLEVIIQPAKNKRSHAQNRLYWGWVHEWLKALSWEDDYTHHFFKYKFLIMIFYQADAKYAGMCDAVKVLKSIDRQSYDQIAAHVIRQTSTTDASTAQMTEYLDKIYRYCYEQGVLLTVPDELKFVRN